MSRPLETNATSDELMETGLPDTKAIIKKTVQDAISGLTDSIVKAVDDRLEDFKRHFITPTNSHELRPSKRLRLDAKQIKKRGNQQQFDHGLKVLEQFESAFDALEQNRVDKAKAALEQGIQLVKHRIKLIRIADKSDFGWETVNQYEADELASDSEDDRRIYRSEKRAEKRQPDKKNKKPLFQPTRPSSVPSSATQPIPTIIPNRPILCAAIGACYACGKFGHLQTKCPQKVELFHHDRPRSTQTWRSALHHGGPWPK